MSQLTNLKPVIRLSIVNPESEHSSVFGRGIAALCLGVKESGSLNAAAKSMGMAYSKAWRIIRDTESTLGVQLLYREGAHGSKLTEDCERLLDLYHSIEEEVQQKAEALYASRTK